MSNVAITNRDNENKYYIFTQARWQGNEENIPSSSTGYLISDQITDRPASATNPFISNYITIKIRDEKNSTAFLVNESRMFPCKETTNIGITLRDKGNRYYTLIPSSLAKE